MTSLCFESQVIHARDREVCTAEASGFGSDTKARRQAQARSLPAHFKASLIPSNTESPEMANITPKNSPLWENRSGQQLFYLASQRWAKRYCPTSSSAFMIVDQVSDAPPLVPVLPTPMILRRRSPSALSAQAGEDRICSNRPSPGSMSAQGENNKLRRSL